MKQKKSSTKKVTLNRAPLKKVVGSTASLKQNAHSSVSATGFKAK
jgi:hypothetical protein